MQYGRKCLLCKNTRQRERDCRLFKFPARGSPMWYRWLEACGLSESDIDPNTREPPRLCQRHFQKKDFLTRQLTGMAVPSVFPIAVYTEISAAQDQQREANIEQTAVQKEEQHQQQVMEEFYQIDSIALAGQEDHYNDVIEYSESIPDSSVDVLNEAESIQLAAIIVPSELNVEAVEEPSPKVTQSCNLDAHTELEAQLQNERAKVDLLSKELLEKDRIIMEQYELLRQLGVQLVTFTDNV